MPQVQISEQMRNRWGLVNQSDREILLLEFAYQTMRYTKDIRSVGYFFFVLAFLSIVVSLFV